MVARAWRAIRGGVGPVIGWVECLGGRTADAISEHACGIFPGTPEPPLLTLPRPEVRHKRPISAKTDPTPAVEPGASFLSDFLSGMRVCGSCYQAASQAFMCGKRCFSCMLQEVIDARPTRDALGCPLSPPEYGRYRSQQ